MKTPWRYFELKSKVASLHALTNDQKVSGLEDQGMRFASLIEQSPKIPTAKKEDVLRYLNELNTGKFLCHGDFHGGNIIIQGNNYFIIDWLDAFIGNPVLDVALSAVNYVVSSPLENTPPIYAWVYDSFKRPFRLDKQYFKAYRSYEQLDQAELGKALVVAAAIHLARSGSEDSLHRKYFDEVSKD